MSRNGTILQHLILLLHFYICPEWPLAQVTLFAHIA
jgi:hypothetical protein